MAKDEAAKDGAKEAAKRKDGEEARETKARAKAAACMVSTSWELGVLMETGASKDAEAKIGRSSMDPRLADIFDLSRCSTTLPQCLWIIDLMISAINP